MLREHFAVQSRQGMEKVDCTEQAGHGKGRLLGKDDSCERVHSSTMNYLSMDKWLMDGVTRFLFTDQGRRF